MDTKPLIVDLTKTTDATAPEEILLPAPQDAPANPFVGLRPFESDESPLFFGRREQTVELLQQLHGMRFLSVVGSSGCGKSSLIKAGLIPKLKAGFLVERRDKWRIATMKPGESPLENLARAMLAAIEQGPTESQVQSLIAEMRVSGVEAISQRLKPLLKDTDTNLLLLVDQFEELFRFGFYTVKERPSNEPDKKEEASEQVADRERRRDQAADFVSLILELARQRELPIYVVMTMRSDFLGDCDAFYGLPEAMNRSQYLVPRLTRQQRQEVIETPIRLNGQTIAPRLLDRLLNDVGEETDQLPILQHVLMRTWEDWQNSGGHAIDVTHYEEVGTIKEALSRDADKALEGISQKDLLIVERMFQALTDTDAQGRRVRRPAHLSEVMAVTGADRRKILEIIERFRSGGRSFLSIDHHSGDPLIDISHESLIRQWETLRGWVDAEAESKDIYQRLAIAAYRHKEFGEGLWSGPALQLALEWKDKRQPNEAWALRYHPELILARRSRPDFSATMDFLENSRKQSEADALERQHQQYKQLESEHRERQFARMRRFAAALALMFLISLVATGFAWQKKLEAAASAQEASRARREAEGQTQFARDQTRIATEKSNQLNDALLKAKQESQRANDEKLKAEEAEKLTEKANEDIKKKNAELVVLQKKTSDQAEDIKQQRTQTLSQLGELYQQAFSLSNDFNNDLDDGPQKAVDKFKEIYDLYQASGIKPGTTSTARIIADLYNQPDGGGESLKAIPFYQEVLDSLGDDKEEEKISIYMKMADILADTEKEEDLRLAISHYQKALDLSGASANDAKAEVLDKLALAYSSSPSMEDKKQAIQVYQQELNLLPDFSESVGQKPRMLGEKNTNSQRASTMIRLSTLYYITGQQPEAEKIFNQQLQFFKRTNPGTERRLLINIGSTFVSRKGEEKAANYLIGVVERLAQEEHNPEVLSGAYWDISQMYSMAGNVPMVIPYMEKALQIYKEQHDKKGEASTYYYLGYAYERAKNKPEAIKYYEMALNLYHELGDSNKEKEIKAALQYIQKDSLKPAPNPNEKKTP